MSVESLIDEHRERFLAELFEFLRIPSVSTTPEHDGDVKRCAQWVADQLAAVGLETTIHATPGHPIVYGERCTVPGAPTILLYGHYDVQPPDPLALWHSPPFEPEVRDGKIFARGATDDKGQVFAHFKGIELARALGGGELPINIKVLIEGEEEVGSQNLEPFVAAQRELLRCDAVVISDTSMFAPGRPSITYGLRGLVYFEITLTGASHDLHSGLFGGAAPNPIHEAARLIALLHDEQGRVTIPGFYDDVRDLSDEEREAFVALAFDDDAFLAETGAAALTGEQGYSTLERLWARPTLDCNGIESGFTGLGAKTVIASKAMAKISCRLVPDQDPERVAEAAEAYLRSQVHPAYRLDFELFHGAEPVIAERDNPTVQAAMRALERSWDTTPVFVRGGGSIPVVATFARVLGVPSVLVGFGLEDDRLHSPNEKINVENFYQGIRTSALLFEEIAKGR